MTDARTRPFGWWGWLWRAALAAVLLVSAAGNLEGVVALATNASFASDLSLGLSYGPTSVQAPRWVGISRVTPGGSAAMAGIQPGDSVRFDALLGQKLTWQPGERVSMTIARGGQRLPKTVVVGPAEKPDSTLKIVFFAFLAQGLVVIGFCVLLLLRGRRNRAAILLATILLFLFLQVPTRWLPHPAATLILLLLTPSTAVITYCWPILCLEISGGPSSRRQSLMVHAAALILTALMLYSVVAGLVLGPLQGSGPLLDAVLILLDQGLGYAILASNYRRNDAPARNRINIVLVAFVCYLLAKLINGALGAWVQAGRPVAQLLWPALAMTALIYLALGLLIYAVLRKRLFDLGFALNRTLVYGAVSFVLLAGFGLAEWGVDHLIPEAWHKVSAIYSAGIALLLFLSVHRLRDVVEQQVERLFFHHWQQNEAALRRFVAAAGHFDQSPALCRAFAEEATRFAEGAPAALYLRTADGTYRLQAGRLAGAGEDYVEDDRAFALMRAERRPVELATAHGQLPGVLALPMLDQGVLAGFVALGGKPEGGDYRPDEVELLGWAAHQVGLDLQGLHARELEAQVVSLNEKVVWLSEDKAKLTALLIGAPVLRSAPQTG